MKTSESIDLLCAALSKAQGEMTPASKDSMNPHFKSKYADLASAWLAAQGPLSRHGLALVQAFGPGEGRDTKIDTRLLHTSGQWIESTLTIYAVNQTPQTPQQLGSNITYFRRYSMMAILGIVPDDDDDGNLASRPSPPPAPRPIPPPPRPIPPPPTPVLDEFYGVALFDVAIDDHKKGFKELMRSRFDYVPQTMWPSLAQSCKGVPATDEHLEKAVLKTLEANERLSGLEEKKDAIINKLIEKLEAKGQTTVQVTGKTPMEIFDMPPGPILDAVTKKILIALGGG